LRVLQAAVPRVAYDRRAVAVLRAACGRRAAVVPLVALVGGGLPVAVLVADDPSGERRF